MAVTPHYTTYLYNMNRAYMSGFVGCAGITNMHWNGEILECDFAGGAYTFSLVVNHKFFVPSSNVYSLDYVFDNAASQVYQGGLPVPSGMWYGYYPMTTRPEWRILILSSLAADETQRLDLTPKANYWRPLY
jgi:hypothetical protein